MHLLAEASIVRLPLVADLVVMSRTSVIFRWIRGLIPALIILILLVCGGSVAWVALVGLPRPLIDLLETECRIRGADVRFGSIRINIWAGVVIYVEQVELGPRLSALGKPVVHVEDIQINLDSDAFWNGTLELERIEVKGINAEVDSAIWKALGPYRAVARIDSGVCTFHNNSDVDFRGFRGELQGMKFQLEGTVKNIQRFLENPDSTSSLSNSNVLPESLRVVLEHLSKITWRRDQPPELKIGFAVRDESYEGGQFLAMVNWETPFLRYGDLALRDVSVDVNYFGNTIWLRQLSCREASGSGQLDLSSKVDLKTREIRSHLKSSIPVLKWILALTDVPVRLPYGLSLLSPPSFQVVSEIRMNDKWNNFEHLQALGNLTVNRFSIGEEEFERFSTDFSYKDGNFYISDFSVKQGLDSLYGQVMGKDRHMKFDLRSTLGVESWVSLVRSFVDEQFNLPPEITLRGDPVLSIKGEAAFPNGWQETPQINHAEVTLRLKDFAVMDVDMGSIAMDAQYQNDRLIIEQCVLQRDNGSLEATGVVIDNEVHFSGSSSFPPQVIERLLKGRASFPQQLKLPQEAQLGVRGCIDLEGETYYGIKSLDLTLKTDAFAWNNVPFASLNLDVLFDNGELMLRSCRLQHVNGQFVELFGQGSLGKDHLFLLGQNTMLLNTWDSLLGLKDDDFFMERFRFNDQSSLSLAFQANLNVPQLLQGEGYVVDAWLEAAHIEYQGVNLASAVSQAVVGVSQVTLTSPKLVYDNKEFLAERNIRGGPSQSTLLADSVVFDFPSDTVRVKGIEGTVYPDYSIRMFSKSTTRVLSKFKFYRPVSLWGSGVFPMGDDMSLMKGNISFRTYSGAVDYPLLGTTLQMSQARGAIEITPEWVRINNLSGSIWKGSFVGKIDARIDEADDLNGVVTVNQLDLASIGQSYDQDLPTATVQGSVSFRSKGGDINTLTGQGEASVVNGDLVNIPLLGQLGNAIASVVPGMNHLIKYNINQARCEFVLEDGYVKSASTQGDSFTAQGSNMALSGGGWIRMSDLYTHADLRVKLRGVPALLTSPLFMIAGGLFRIQGEGPVDDIQWTPAPFSRRVEAPTKS